MKQNFYCIRFYVTFRCNSRCTYCNVWREDRFRNVRELPLDQARELLRQAWEVGGRYIDFTGGEPTLYPHLRELVSYARELGFKTEVTSNAVWADKSFYETAETADKFNVSLDTLDSQVYRNQRGIDRHEQVLAHIRRLKTRRPPKLMSVVTQENLPELDELEAFACRQQAQLYLNPVFSYFDGQKPDPGGCIGAIARRTFHRGTVVMHHFLEMITHPEDPERPVCSANRHTLTFAPDGSLMLPCYHCTRETIPWEGDLSKALSSEAFARYWQQDAPLPECRSCAVVPYFGISLQYKLNRYFLLQSFSEKLNHLKRDYLNDLPELNWQHQRLLPLLRELLQTLRELRLPPCQDLYPAEKTEAGWVSPVYRMPIPEDLYRREQAAADCWELHLVPHFGWDRMVRSCFPRLREAYLAGDSRISAYALDHAMECQLRWWLWYIQRHFRVKTDHHRKHELWLRRYCDIIGYDFAQALESADMDRSATTDFSDTAYNEDNRSR